MFISRNCFVLSFVLIMGLNLIGQTVQNNQAVVTIVGDPIQSNSTGNKSAPSSSSNNAPPTDQKIVDPNKTIDPNLENGFHIRFEINSEEYTNQGGALPATASSTTTSSGSGIGGGYSKTKKHTPTIIERKINTKKRLKSWLPHRKKKYRPHLCGRF